tara:strand:- start:958 stop:1470 length:513 start_codon:yes stop_codon:yes gene_type:complete
MSKLVFEPLLSPRQIIEYGAFGGCYFGFPIEEYTNYDYDNLFNQLFDGLDIKLYLGENYSPKLNQFKLRSGMDYEYWKEMNWMHEDDPYGWFEWYCKYTLGRRHEDDDRQITRWQNFCGKNGRWKDRIYSNIYKTKDWKVSPRIQQSLLHWGYFVNDYDFEHWKYLNKKL